MKWFHPDHRGLISGIVVSGFGLAPVYIAPLTSILIHSYGLRTTMIIMGIVFFSVVFFLSFLIRNPPEDFEKIRLKKKPKKKHKTTAKNYTVHEVLRTP